MHDLLVLGDFGIDPEGLLVAHVDDLSAFDTDLSVLEEVGNLCKCLLDLGAVDGNLSGLML